MPDPVFRTVGSLVLALAASTLVCLTPALAQDGDAAEGEKVFRKCSTCHNIGEGAKNKVGPALTGVIGRPAGTFEGFRYGDSIKALGETGFVWTEDDLFIYLEDPREFLRTKLDDQSAKSKMAFKLKQEDQRRDVIEYVKTFSNAE